MLNAGSVIENQIVKCFENSFLVHKLKISDIFTAIYSYLSFTWVLSRPNK